MSSKNKITIYKKTEESTALSRELEEKWDLRLDPSYIFSLLSAIYYWEEKYGPKEKIKESIENLIVSGFSKYTIVDIIKKSFEREKSVEAIILSGNYVSSEAIRDKYSNINNSLGFNFIPSDAENSTSLNYSGLIQKNPSVPKPIKTESPALEEFKEELKNIYGGKPEEIWIDEMVDEVVDSDNYKIKTENLFINEFKDTQPDKLINGDKVKEFIKGRSNFTKGIYDSLFTNSTPSGTYATGGLVNQGMTKADLEKAKNLFEQSRINTGTTRTDLKKAIAQLWQDPNKEDEIFIDEIGDDVINSEKFKDDLKVARTKLQPDQNECPKNIDRNEWLAMSSKTKAAILDLAKSANKKQEQNDKPKDNKRAIDL